MRKIRVKKPDIKGFFQRVRNIRWGDIKQDIKARRERRARILEKRRNSAFEKKMQPVYKWMNRLSLLCHFVLACILNFLI